MPSADRIANERIPSTPAIKKPPPPPPAIKPLPPAILEALKADKPTAPKPTAAKPTAAKPAAPLGASPVNLGGQLAATSGSATAKAPPIPASNSTWSFQPEPPAAPAATTTTRRYDGGDVVVTNTTEGNVSTSLATIRNQDGTTTKSWVERQSVEGNLEDLVPPELSPMLENQIVDDSEAQRGPVQIVHTQIHDIDRAGVATTRSDTTSYSQHLATTFSDSNDGLSSLRLPDVENPAEGALPTELPLQANDFASLDGQRSGQTLTLTTGTVRTGQGQLQEVRSRSNELSLVGESRHGGGPARYSQSSQLTTLDGQVASENLIVEARNLFVADDIATQDEFASLKLHDDFAQRVTTGETFDYRRITDVANGVLVTREFGDYASPQKVGHSVTVVDGYDGQPTSLTYRKVLEGGNRVQSQTVFEGTQLSTVTDVQTRANGDRHGSSVSRDGDRVIASTEESSQLVSVSATTAAELGVDPVWWDLFVEQHPEATVRVESSSSQNSATQESSERLSVTAPSGDFLRLSSIETEQGSSTASFLRLANSTRPEQVRLQQNGSVENFALDSHGNVRLNGVIQTVTEVADRAEEVASLSRTLSESKLMPVFSALNLGEAAADLIQGNISLENASELATSSSDLLSLAGRQLAGRFLGVAGAGFTAVDGVTDVIQGRYAEGAGNLLQVGGMGLVLAGFPGAGWTVLGALTAFQLLNNLAPDESDFDTAPLLI